MGHDLLDVVGVVAVDVAVALFARGAVVREFVAELADVAARDLAARVRGTPAAAPPRLAVGGFLWRVIGRWLRGVFGRR